MTIASTFILGLFTGAIITASFAAWAAMHERTLRRTRDSWTAADDAYQYTLVDRYTDVGRFAEHGGLCGPGARIVSDDLTGSQ